MAIRHSFCLLFAALISVTGSLWAQPAPYWAQGSATGDAGYGNYAASPYAPYGESPYMPAGYSHPGQAPHPDLFCPPPNIMTTDPGDDRPLGRFLSNSFERSWIRLEYLAWSMSSPGNQLLGAPLHPATGVDNPREDFPVFDADAILLGFAHVNDLSFVSFNDNHGIRGTFGKETTWGEFQANVWGVRGADSFRDEIEPGFFAATTTKTLNELSNNVFLWDEGFTANYETDLWGMEAKFLLDRGVWAEGFSLRPLVGFQFIELDDHLVQIGQFNAGGTSPTRTGYIDNSVQNNLFGPTLGLHLKGELGPLTVGFEPKVALAVSSVRGRVSTFQLRTFDDGLVQDQHTHWQLAPVLQSNVYLRWRLNEYFSLFGSWDAMYLTRVARSGDTINYNDNVTLADPDAPAALSYSKIMNGFFMEGFTVGGEFMLW